LEKVPAPLPFSSATDAHVKKLVPSSETNVWEQISRVDRKKPSEHCSKLLDLANNRIGDDPENGVQAWFTIIMLELLVLLSDLFPSLGLSMLPHFRMESKSKFQRNVYGWVDWALGIGPIFSGDRSFRKPISLLTFELKVFEYFLLQLRFNAYDIVLSSARQP